MGFVIETPSQWVQRAREGDALAFGQLYDDLSAPVNAFLHGLRLGLGASDIQDAVQETFLRFFKQLGKLDAERPLRPYVLGIARHVALDLCRRARPEGTAGSGIDRVPGDARVSDVVARDEEDTIVGEALDALKPEARAALTLRHVNGLTMEELASSLGCSVPTARNRLRKAARMLAAELRRRGVLPREDAE